MTIHCFTISVFGHCAARHSHDSSKLGRSAVEFLTSLLEGHGNRFHSRIPLKGLKGIELRWQSEHLSSGLGTFYAEGNLLSTNVIISGINAEADKKALQLAQAGLRTVCEATGEEAAEDLIRIQARPALATIRWTTRGRRVMDLVSDMEVCLAAAFLERAFHTAELGL
jgi:hypothetical protein